MKTVIRSRRLAAWTLALAAALAPAALQAQQNSNQMALVTISSYDELQADVDYIGRLGGEQNLGQQMEGMVNLFAQGLNGLDRSRPIGIAVYSDGGPPYPQIMLPVTDLNALTGVLGAFGIVAEPAGDGITKLTSPQGPIFAKESDGWAIVSTNEDAVKARADDPAKLIAQLSDNYDLGVRIYVQNIPAEYRQMAMQQIRDGMEQGMVRDPNESDDQFAMRKKLAEAQVEQFTEILEGSDELTFGWSLDGKEEKTFFDFVITSMDGSKLARQLSQYTTNTTDYAGFYQPEAAGMANFAGKVTEDDIAQSRAMMGTFRDQLMKQIDEEADLPDDKAREVVKSAVGDFFDAMTETLEGGKMDGGAVFNAGPNTMSVVVGGLIADPQKVVDGFKKLEALAEEEEDFPGITWNADKHGGISFHTIEVPVPDHEEEARQLFGDSVEVALGAGGKSVYVAFGRDAVAEAKKVIDASEANRGKEIPPAEMSLSLTPIMEMAASLDDDPVVARISEMLKGDSQGRDHVRMVEHLTDDGKGLKVRIELESGVLQAIGTAVQEFKNQQQGG